MNKWRCLLVGLFSLLCLSIPYTLTSEGIGLPTDEEIMEAVLKESAIGVDTDIISIKLLYVRGNLKKMKEMQKWVDDVKSKIFFKNKDVPPFTDSISITGGVREYMDIEIVENGIKIGIVSPYGSYAHATFTDTQALEIGRYLVDLLE